MDSSTSEMFKEHIDSLKDESSSIRSHSLTTIAQMIDKKIECKQFADLDVLFNESLWLPLCQIMTDESENNREIAFKILLKLNYKNICHISQINVCFNAIL